MMSDDMLSQDEIDALLKGTDDDSSDSVFNVEDYLTGMEQDALGEIGNISFGSSATALSTLLSQKVDITTPTVTVLDVTSLKDEFPHPYVAIQVSYTEGFSGSNLLVIKQEDAAIIADLMLGGNGKDPADLLGEIQLSAVQEAMNQMMGSAATSMSTIFSKKVDISPPSIDILNVEQGEGTDRIPDDDMIVKISFRLRIGDLIDSNIMQVLPLNFAKSLVHELMNPESMQKDETVELKKEEAPAAGSSSGMQNNGQSTSQLQGHQMPENRDVYRQPEQQTQVQQPSSPQHFGAAYPGTQQPQVQPAAFSNFETHQLQETETKNLDMLLDIPLQVTVELGRTKRSVKDILQLSAGSIVELDKLAGEPVDILVNSRLIAKGEVVVIEENFGVRVTDIISQSDRIKKLR
ncbi:flagellar motor switch phosphatase FliY [Bacillus infantis]|uniref:flagellar motor switch phosphatase FliY n=1 Tax=Bacillus infantis TaxID=324767 RepID=UPI002155EB50|nr:flagellar motor switch phosphatase FliY [Bacillus infantis]MCR6610482.1 flagellar motor switch phosphatase FliY [Bacillus infantis]